MFRAIPIHMARTDDRKLGLWPVLAIGVGGLVGGGIFAVLGLAVQTAHGGTPLAFALAGAEALLTAYAYARLSVAWSSRGGTVIFIDRSFGSGMFSGSMNVLLWLSYVVMLSLCALSFGSYAATFLPQPSQGMGKHVLLGVGVIVLTGPNLLSAAAADRGRDDHLPRLRGFRADRQQHARCRAHPPMATHSRGCENFTNCCVCAERAAIGLAGEAAQLTLTNGSLASAIRDRRQVWVRLSDHSNTGSARMCSHSRCEPPCNP